MSARPTPAAWHEAAFVGELIRALRYQHEREAGNEGCERGSGAGVTENSVAAGQDRGERQPLLDVRGRRQLTERRWVVELADGHDQLDVLFHELLEKTLEQR